MFRKRNICSALSSISRNHHEVESEGTISLENGHIKMNGRSTAKASCEV